MVVTDVKGATKQVKEIWKKCDAVCFDVDSTVCRGEGIDELAAYCGVGDRVAEITQKAMSEGLSFREALHERLTIIKPTRDKLNQFLTATKPNLTSGIKELVSQLRSKNVSIFLVSGGFRSVIEPVAMDLGIPKENIFANRLLFEENGAYKGFDEDEPTSSSGGKPRVVEKLKSEHQFKCLVMIGDGMTDLEAHPPADLFIGFGGNKIRENVRKAAPWFVTDFNVLMQALNEN